MSLVATWLHRDLALLTLGSMDASIRILTVAAAFAALAAGADIQHKTSDFQGHAGKIGFDEYAVAGDAAQAVVLLYGSGGLRATGFPLEAQARLLARGGRRVYVPHYLDATRGSAGDPELHYEIWARTVLDAIGFIGSRNGIPPERIAIAGYSLGASVALAAAAMEPRLAGVVDWSGSLPDAYREVNWLPPLLILHGGKDRTVPVFNARQLAELCSLRGFACELNIEPEEDHAFSAAAIERVDGLIQDFLNRVLPRQSPAEANL